MKMHRKADEVSQTSNSNLLLLVLEQQKLLDYLIADFLKWNLASKAVTSQIASLS